MTPWLRLVVAAAAAVAIAAGCGGGGLSSEQLTREADAICAGANVKVRLIGPEPPILTAEQASWIERLTRIDRQAVAKLRELEPESGRRRTFEEMLSAFERGLGHGEAIARASRAHDESTFRAAVEAALGLLQKAQGSAAGLGLRECALLGRVVR
jgi:hypothetical protein